MNSESSKIGEAGKNPIETSVDGSVISEKSICAKIKSTGGRITSEIAALACVTAAKFIFLFKSMDKRGAATEAVKGLVDVEEMADRIPEGAKGPAVKRILAMKTAAMAVRAATFAILVLQDPLS